MKLLLCSDIHSPYQILPQPVIGLQSRKRETEMALREDHGQVGWKPRLPAGRHPLKGTH
jgi:hypothetical protein